MKRITSFEIRCLKELLKIYRARIFQREQQIINLELENEELRQQLEESRAKEGKGALEKAMESLADFVNGICDAIFEKPHDEIESLIIQNNNDEEDDT